MMPVSIITVPLRPMIANNGRIVSVSENGQSVGVSCSAVSGNGNSIGCEVGAGGHTDPLKSACEETRTAHKMHDESVINKRDV